MLLTKFYFVLFKLWTLQRIIHIKKFRWQNFDSRNVLYVLGNDKAENDQPPEAANMPLRSIGEQMVTEPPSTVKSVETSESISVSPSQADNQLPPEELRLFKLSLEAASELQTS